MVKQYYSNELYHHGVKGQKWGIRKFRPINNRPNISRNQYNDTSERKRLSPGVKKTLIVGGVIAGSIAVDLAISKFNKRMVLSLASASKQRGKSYLNGYFKLLRSKNSMNYKIKNKLADNLIKANSHLKRKATIKRSKSIVTNRIKRTPIDTINVNRVHVKRVPINKININ